MLEMLRATLCAWMLVPSPIFHQAVNGICLISTLFLRNILEVHFFEQFEKDFLGGESIAKQNRRARSVVLLAMRLRVISPSST